MSDFEECPECGETNHYEELDKDGLTHIQYFTCGFQGDDDGRRRAVCEHSGGGTGDSTPTGDSARYRLALLDAAQVVDAMASDMTQENIPGNYAQRCRDLSKQLREFAGHSNTSSNFEELSGFKGLISKVKPW